jgi:hypothetical protein
VEIILETAHFNFLTSNKRTNKMKVKPKDGEWWMCRNTDSIMGLQTPYFYKDNQWWYGATEAGEVKSPFSSSGFYKQKLKPLYLITIK